MKKIFFFLIFCNIATSYVKADTLQNNKLTLCNITANTNGLQVNCDISMYLSHSIGIPYIIDPLVFSGIVAANTTTIKGYELTFVCKDLLTGDTVHFKFIPGFVPGTTTAEKKDTNCFLPPLSLQRHLKLDSVLFTGVELKTKYTFTLPHHGKWRIMYTTTHTPCSFRDKKISNLDTFNTNPNLFYGFSSTRIHDAMTVVGYSEFNSIYDNSGITYMSETNFDWKYFDNGVENNFNLGITPITLTDSIVVTHVQTITSDISPIPVPDPTNLGYLFDTIKNVPFRNGYTLAHPFTCDIFNFDPVTQDIHFKVAKNTPQQAVSLNFKIDVYRSGIKIGTYYREFLFVIKEPKYPAIPNAISEIEKNKIFIYPNPANNWIAIENYSGQVEIFNITGQKIFEEKSFSEKINTSTWPNGLYLVKTGDLLTKVEVLH